MSQGLEGLMGNDRFIGKWMILHDFMGAKLIYAQVNSVAESREIWKRVAGPTGITCCLVGFTVVERLNTVDGGEVIYQGNYVTDEC